ncbi:hypothetical protein ACFXAF_16330 [Kitasatospora sp. NPDC059463]|uniref:hypothetical protein n=1 Tax=unclassified Kitasatospora TaxID=2633591 RepID=UPI0036787FB4
MTGPSKGEANRPPVGWNPLDDYRAANPAGSPLSVGSQLQREAVLSSCVCRDCKARRPAA